MTGTYLFANIVVRVESLHDNVHRLCHGYQTNGQPRLTVRTTQEDIDFEHARSKAADIAAGRNVVDYNDGYLELLAVYRKIAEAMPVWNTMLVHGSCLAVDGAAYLFCAPSGTGKSTHACLWRELLGNRVVMVNDDKPLVRVADGTAMVFGTPWDGKHHLSSNVAVPLRAVCLLGRDESNHIERASLDDAFPSLLGHVYRPIDPTVLLQTLTLVDRLVGCVDLWRLGCNMDLDAARVSFAAMSGERA